MDTGVMDPTPYTLMILLVGTDVPVTRDGFTQATCEKRAGEIRTTRYDFGTDTAARGAICKPTSYINRLHKSGIFEAEGWSEALKAVQAGRD